ncbi:hypothetical protein PVAND_001379 [Polypedilum vanderplanki]|uniref:UBA domain-containing protein n=1 Tax=Polypedilum vanderplanki TaxID=319348 RepID=A0A9J6BNA1_POLVA|nr:hypothetical protein PVAND_001379 [Polypedilum vanderplanki]
MFTELLSSIRNLLWSSRIVNNSSTQLIKVITSNFGVFIFQIEKHEILLYIKKLFLNAIDETDEEKLLQMKLIHVRTGKELNDFESLEVLKIKSNEEFILIFYRNKENEENFHHGPKYDEIYSKTKILPTNPNQMRPIANFNYILRQDDLKKIFITLAQECAYIIGIHSYSNKLINFYRQKIHNYISTRKDVFKVLCHLGFPKKHVERALKLSANNYKIALDWLIDNVKYHETTETSPRLSLTSSNRRYSILSSKFNPNDSTISERVEGLLEIVNFYSEKDEAVFIDYLTSMIFMGYEIDEAREALTLTNNNIGAACAYLAGESNPSILELRRGLSNSSHIYKSLMNSSQVQELLSFPESFVYFLTFIDKRQFEWETFEHSYGDIMEYIVNLYHEEKHSLAVNQFNNSLIPISALSASNS